MLFFVMQPTRQKMLSPNIVSNHVINLMSLSSSITFMMIRLIIIIIDQGRNVGNLWLISDTETLNGTLIEH